MSDSFVKITPLGPLGDACSSLRDGQWAAAVLSGSAGALDVAAAATNPAGSMMTWGYEYLLEHLEPLSSLLDKLAVKADEAHAQAGLLKATAGRLTGQADQLKVERYRGFVGATAQAHEQARAALHGEMDETAAAVAATAQAMVDAASVVATVRATVRAVIAEVLTTFTLGAGAIALSGGTLAPGAIGAFALQVRSAVQRLWPAINRLVDALAELNTLLIMLSRTLRTLRRPGVTPSSPARLPDRRPVPQWLQDMDERYLRALDPRTYKPRLPRVEEVHEVFVDQAKAMTAKAYSARADAERLHAEQP